MASSRHLLPPALALIAVWVVSYLGGLGMDVAIRQDRLTHESGHAWIVTIKGGLFQPADDTQSARYGLARLDESAKPLGPGRSLHADIRLHGHGRYALDRNALRLSTLNGADPSVQRGAYRLRAAAIPTTMLTSLSFAALVASVLYAFGTRSELSIGSGLSIAIRSVAWIVATFGGTWLAFGMVLIPTVWAIPLLLTMPCVPLLPLKPIVRSMETTRIRLAEAGNTDNRSAIAFIALFVALWCASLLLTAPFNVNYNDTLNLTLWRTGEITLPPGTLLTVIYPTVQVILPRILATIHQFGLDAILVHKVLGIVFVLAGLSAICLTAIALSQARGLPAAGAGLYTVLVFLESWFSKLHVGYPILLHVPTLLLGAWGLAALMLAWAIWLLASTGTRSAVLGFVLAGLIFDLHSTYVPYPVRDCIDWNRN